MSILDGFEIIRNDENFIPLTRVANENLNVHTIRPLQEKVYNEYINEPLFILSEPPGSGKSTTIKFVSTTLLKENPNMKIVIAVPYTILSKSFGKIMLEFPNSEQTEWDIYYNLCETTRESKVKELRYFIQKETIPENLSQRVAIVTHSTLSRLHQEYPDDWYNDVMFVIDEAHHVLYPETDEVETANKIGQFVQYLLTDVNTSIRIWFTTATFYRGDKFPIIPEEYMEKFVKYYLPLDEYWRKYIRYIKSFSYEFVLYKERDVFSGIKQIFEKKGKRKTIIYCPYTGYLVNGSTKIEFRDKIIQAIKEVWNDCRILDLVEVEGRDERKSIVLNDSDSFDVVLAVRLFDEGTDWDLAESIIDLFPSNSLRIQVQRFGRLLRDVPGKNHIDYNAFFPYEADFEDDKERRLHLSRCFNALTASCLLHEAIEPVSYPYKTSRSGGTNNVTKEDFLTNEVPDEAKKQELLEKVIKDLMFLKNIVEEPTVDEVKECVSNTLKTFGIENNIDEISEQVIRIIRKSTLPKRPDWESQTTDVSWMIEAGFDKVWDNSIFDDLLSFGTGFCGIETFKEFRRVISKHRTVEEWLVITKEIYNREGKFNCHSIKYKELYPGLSSVVYKHFDKFKKYVIFKKHVGIDKLKIIATDIENKNGGILPCLSDIKKINSSLFISLKKSEGLWKGFWQYFGRGINRVIKILGTNKTIPAPDLEKEMSLCIRLMKENDGMLPKLSRVNRDLSNLQVSISRNPYYYHGVRKIIGEGCGIRVKTIGTDKIELIRDVIPLYAEVKKISDDNGGVLPNYKNLSQKIASAISTNPEVFEGFKQVICDSKGVQKGIRIIGEVNAKK